MLDLKDIILQNNSFFVSEDYKKAKEEYDRAEDKKKYLLHLKYNIGSDEESYCKWRGMPYTKNPYPKYILSNQKIYYGDYEEKILEEQEKYIDM